MAVTKNIFKEASRHKYRYQTSKGLLSVEDLWDLPLRSEKGPSLDSIALDLHKELQQADTLSFVIDDIPKNVTHTGMFSIVKEIIEVRLQERTVAKEEATLADKKRRLMELIAKKEEENLAGESLEDLKAMLASM